MSKKRKTEYDKRVRRRGILLVAGSAAMAFGLHIAGQLLSSSIPAELAMWMFTVCVCLPLLWLPVSLLMAKVYKKRINSMDLSRMQRMMLRERERAEEAAVQGPKKLRRLRIYSDALAAVLVLCGVGAAIGGGVLYGASPNLLRMYGAFCWILCGLTQLRFPTAKDIFTDDKTYVSEAEYPKLYALTRQAAKALGCWGDIAISLQGDFNGGIARIGDTYSVQLGAMLLELLSEGELYTVLLHEFGHMDADNDEDNREKNYCAFLTGGKNAHVFGWFAAWLFRFTDLMYLLEYFLYDYACAVRNENNADGAMAAHGDTRYAASALLKMKYYELYQWEQGVEDVTPFYATPDAPKHVIADQLRSFRAAMALRAEEWNKLVDCEIISRVATHPTLKMRLETLGVENWGIAESADSEEYRAECTKAREYVEALVYENGVERYKAERLEAYLKPVARVAEWENAGKPLTPESYGDMIGDLRAMGRNREAEALCSRAIEELDTAAACYAYFMRGLIRLHRYDPAGMNDLYHAIANNGNYIDEGLEAIGQFCCITGRQEELDTYRARALQIDQHQRDVYSELNVLRKQDVLTSERELPENLRAGLLETVYAADDGTVEAVYLVRKTITEEFFATVVVVKFHGTPQERRNEILHKLFSYLDTCSDWQFTLFDYDEVKKTKPDRIPDSCIYQRERKTE